MKYCTESMGKEKSYIQYNEGRLDWSYLAFELPSKTFYWRKETRDEQTEGGCRQLVDEVKGKAVWKRKH